MYHSETKKGNGCNRRVCVSEHFQVQCLLFLIVKTPYFAHTVCWFILYDSLTVIISVMSLTTWSLQWRLCLLWATINTQEHISARINSCGHVIAELIRHNWVSPVNSPWRYRSTCVILCLIWWTFSWRCTLKPSNWVDSQPF